MLWLKPVSGELRSDPRRNVETTDDWILSPVPMSALGCGSTGQFNTMTASGARSAKIADLLHGISEGPDVGLLESWRYLARDRQAV